MGAERARRHHPVRPCPWPRARAPRTSSIEPKEDEVAVATGSTASSSAWTRSPSASRTRSTRKLFEIFGLDPARADAAADQPRRQAARRERLRPRGQTLPTALGTSATIKLVNRATFIKDFAHAWAWSSRTGSACMEELRWALRPRPRDLARLQRRAHHVLLDHELPRAQRQRDVLSLESPIHWPMDGARQVEVESGPERPADGGDAALGDRGAPRRA